MRNQMDRLMEKIEKLQNPTVIGLDPRPEMIPLEIRKKYDNSVEGISKAVIEWNHRLIDAVQEIIPAIKPQLAFYEMLGIEGMKAFEDTCNYAKQKDMIIIADNKRGDIGSTAEAYAKAYLGKVSIGEKKESIFDVDFVTVNPYLGIDGVKPFIDICKEEGKGAFILVKTSNPYSGEIQDLRTEDGIEIYKKVALLVEEWGKELIGEKGYSSIAAVVGATYPKQLQELRQIMPHSYFLIPGYGAQGGKANDIALGFDKNGLGGIVNASRSLICAYQKEENRGLSIEEATRQEAIQMKEELNQAIRSK